MNKRTATLERKSNETQITAELTIDGTGKTSIKTPIKILDHMLELFSFHGFFDLQLSVTGDVEIDIHHTNEDIGIVLGKIFRKALGEMEGIRRFGFGFSPMESTLGRSVVDISGRGYFTLNVQNNGVTVLEQENYSLKYLEHFMESFAHGLGATINVTIENPDQDLHTCIETVFKSLGIALDTATQQDPRRGNNVPSTKGIID